jgi:DNA polymerase III delta prime subunit
VASKLVDAIFVRQITAADFFNIERSPETDKGGGSQTYIDIPLGQNLSLLEKLWKFLGCDPLPERSGKWPPIRITARVLSNPAVTNEIQFAPRQGVNSRYRIANQTRQKRGSARHPAWTQAYGFPEAPNDIRSKDDDRIPPLTNLRVYIIRTLDKQYYAGFINTADMPANWPKNVGLERLFASGVSADMIEFDSMVSTEVPHVVHQVLEAWKQRKNVLLYGPPGTGKTYAMQLLWKLLTSSKPTVGLTVDPENKDAPFGVAGVELPLASPIRREWVTFHQNYSYESFILALRPHATGGGITLKPRLGVLLDAAVSTDDKIVQDEAHKFKSAVVLIDEINRGNVSRIFGEFITFMEEDYRADSMITPIPVPLSGVTLLDDKTEPIERLSGGTVELPIPWFFPPNVYVLASMNSVDRAVAPLDTALARRFVRIQVAPDMALLARSLGIADTKALTERFRRTKDQRDNIQETIPEIDVEETVAETPSVTQGHEDAPETPLLSGEVSWLLLYRLNYELASIFGQDFELGHTYILPVAKGSTEDERYRILASIWDQALYPQLQERFISRPDELARLLRMDRGRGKSPRGFLFVSRVRPSTFVPGMTTSRDVIDVPPIANASLDDIKVTLKFLAGA